MWSSCVGSYTQRISAVSTEQSQIGVKRWEERNPKKRENSGHELNRRLFKERNKNTEEISSLVGIPRTSLASGNRTSRDKSTPTYL